jgi:ankyrin repeat protein
MYTTVHRVSEGSCENSQCIVTVARKEIQINQTANEEDTPLIVALYFGNALVVKALLSHDSVTTTDTCTCFGKTAYLYDCTEANMRIASWSHFDEEINENGRFKCQHLLKLFEEKKK